MKRGAPTLAGIIFAALLSCQGAFAVERILSFDSIIQVNRDGSMRVTELIRVRAERNQIKRGIYRDFPTRYKDRHGVNLTPSSAKTALTASLLPANPCC